MIIYVVICRSREGAVEISSVDDNPLCNGNSSDCNIIICVSLRRSKMSMENLWDVMFCNASLRNDSLMKRSLI